MGIEDVLAKDMDYFLKEGSALFIRKETGAEDPTNYIQEQLKNAGYTVLSAKTAPGMPLVQRLKDDQTYQEMFKMEKPPKVIYGHLASGTGLMIASTQREDSEMDPDIFAGMFTAVMSFVKDSLGGMGKEGRYEEIATGGFDMQGMRFSYASRLEQKDQGLVELCTLVTAIEGKETEELEKDMRRIVKEFYEKHSAELDDWHGELNGMKGSVEDFLNFFFNSKKYEGEIPLERLSQKAEQIKHQIYGSFERAGNIALVLDGCEEIDQLSAETLSRLSHTPNLKIVCQYEVDVGQEETANPHLKSTIEHVDKKAVVDVTSGINLERWISEKFEGLDEKDLKALQYLAVAGEFTPDLLWNLNVSKESFEKLKDAGILTESGFANKKIQMRAIESLEKPRVVYSNVALKMVQLHGEEDAYVPKLAELFMNCIEENPANRELAVTYSLKASELARKSFNLERALDYSVRAVNVDQNIGRKIETLKTVLGLDWVTTKHDELLQHATELEQLAKETGSARDEGFATWFSAKTYSSKQMFDDALEKVEIAERIFDELKDPSMLSKVLNTKGLIFERKKRLDESMDAFNKALELCSDDLNQKARILQNIGNLYKWKGDFANAEKSMMAAIHINETIGEDISRGACLSELSEILYNAGDLEQTISVGKDAIEVCLQSGGIAYAIVAYNNVGGALVDLNRFEESKDFLEKGIAISKRLNYLNFLDSLLTNKAVLGIKELLLNIKEPKHLDYLKSLLDIEKK